MKRKELIINIIVCCIAFITMVIYSVLNELGLTTESTMKWYEVLLAISFNACEMYACYLLGKASVRKEKLK